MGENKTRTNGYIMAITLAAIGLFVGCKAKPAPDSGFVPHPEAMKKNELVPADRVWRDPKVKAAHYNKIIIAPVRVDKQLDRSWLERNNVRAWLNEEDKDIAEFARYTEGAFKRAAARSKKFTLTDKPGPNTLILELALVKVVPGKPLLGAAKNLAAPIVGAFRATAFLVAPARTAVSSSTSSPLQSSVAFEGIIRDAQTKKIVAMFADDEKQNAAIFNTKDFSTYGNLKQIVDAWSAKFIEVLEKRPLETGVKVEKDGLPIKLIN